MKWGLISWCTTAGLFSHIIISEFISETKSCRFIFIFSTKMHLDAVTVDLAEWLKIRPVMFINYHTVMWPLTIQGHWPSVADTMYVQYKSHFSCMEDTEEHNSNSSYCFITLCMSQLRNLISGILVLCNLRPTSGCYNISVDHLTKKIKIRAMIFNLTGHCNYAF